MIAAGGSSRQGMHLAYVTAALPLSSGETFIVPEILELQRRGHRVTVIPVWPRRPVIHEDARALTGSTVWESLLSLNIVRSAIAELFRGPAAVLQASLLVARSGSLRLLLKNLAVFPKGLWLARLARQERVDHIHAHWASTSATAALIASVVSGIPWSFTAHRWDIPENNLLEMKAQTADFARAIDARGGQELATRMGPHRQKLRVIHMGVASRFAARAEPERHSGPLRVLLGARFVAVKGHRYALEALARLEAAGVDVLLDCAGDGPLLNPIERHAVELGVRERVRFLGMLDHEELLARLRNREWDAALLPSIETGKHREGIPVFLIEAMGAGVPVVSTATGGIPELLEGGAGILIPERDPKAIADALARLADDGALRRRLAEAGARRVREQYTVESTVSALLGEISMGRRQSASPR